jgi:hypothetical protein
VHRTVTVVRGFLEDGAKIGCRRSLASRERRLPKMLIAQDTLHMLPQIVCHRSSEVGVRSQHRHEMVRMLSGLVYGGQRRVLVHQRVLCHAPAAVVARDLALVGGAVEGGAGSADERRGK